MDFLLAVLITFFSCFILVPVVFWFFRMFGFYAIVEEGTCHIYTLFGKVKGVLDEPGLAILPLKIGPSAFILRWFGTLKVLPMRLDQEYLRSQPVNSEEGAPMGIGIWYEMFISDPVAFLFKNTDPRGSLRANVSNTTVRCLSNMKLGDMLETRHTMSRTVRDEVSPKSHEWGYQLGSVYIRKVHFRDEMMIRQIEEKVVNRLRQVTSAIRQDGANQVGLITSTAERQAAVEFAKALALRPRIVGEALAKISQDPEVAQTLFDILETQRALESDAAVTLIPAGRAGGLLPDLLAAQGAARPAPARPVGPATNTIKVP
ncbi:MAG: SPFH/Band 7/PHB domain protein [Deltaproteobacteria bacterium]|nr:SPFH/Band 7/PHB domain protein [Deltaproteobacteria bacterium]